MEYREAELTTAGREEEDDDVATTTSGRRREPPPLTHDDNRGFLRMLRDKKERYVSAIYTHAS